MTAQHSSMRDYVKHTLYIFPSILKLLKNQQMINVTFMGEVQRDIKKKLQKLEGFAGMNSSQLLEVETKVFVN
jgi:hypothetical protein